MNALDLAVLVAYLGGVLAWGLWRGGRQHDAEEYFLADHGLPWWAISFSTVATETSALTFISVPATAYTGDFWIMQLAFGYLIGRITVAFALLPAHYRGEMSTAYTFLGRRFGPLARRFASGIFMLTRAMADSVRVFAAAIPVALITGLPYWQAILAIGLVTLVYTYYGGLKAVVWVDVVQLILYTLAGVLALALLLDAVPGGWEGLLAALPAGKLEVFHFEGGFADASWFLTAVLGGAFLSMASHGIDHLIVQRLLAAHSLRDAQKALVGDALLVIGQFALFLLIGAALFVFYGGREFAVADEIFPRFIIEQFPPGLAGLTVAGILAAAMSTLSSSLSALASAATLDVYAPLAGRDRDSEHLMRVGRGFTLLWAAVLIGGAVLFQFAAEGDPVVVIALQIASFTYGALLGGFLLGLLSERAGQRDAVAGMASAILVMGALWSAQQFELIPTLVNPLWFALIGSAVTIGVGEASGRVRGGRSRSRAGVRARDRDGTPLR